jgi:hypothetical protein
MRYPTIIVLVTCVCATAIATADQPLDCSKKSLAAAVADARAKDPTIAFTGICSGPIVIKTEGVTLQGVGEAIIDGAGLDAVTISGAARVTLTGIEVRNGLNGIVAVTALTCR